MPSPLKSPETVEYAALLAKGEFSAFWKIPSPFPSITEISPVGEPLSATAMSGFPSALKSATRAGPEPVASGKTTRLPNVSLPCPSKILTESELATNARSACPSALKSSMTKSYGVWPTLTLTGCANVPSPFPRIKAMSTGTWKRWLDTAKSALPSWLKSPATTSVG